MSYGHFYFSVHFFLSGFDHGSLTYRQQTLKQSNQGHSYRNQELWGLKEYIDYVKRELHTKKQLLMSWVIIFASSNFPPQCTYVTLITNREDKTWRKRQRQKRKASCFLSHNFQQSTSMVCTLKVRAAKYTNSSCQMLQETAIFVFILIKK